VLQTANNIGGFQFLLGDQDMYEYIFELERAFAEELHPAKYQRTFTLQSE
jgi:hypothetical protein